MQKLVEGEHSIREAAAQISKEGYTHVFLITGKHIDVQWVMDALKGLQVYHYIKEGVNVKEEEIEKAYALFKSIPHQAIVGIGGGSVIDLGKGMIYHCLGHSSTVPFFIAAPTTAGSGSEATPFAVIYRNGRKISLVHPFLLPQSVILDPSLLDSLPSRQVAVSGMDVLSQAVESYWNRNADQESKQYAGKAIELWKQNFLAAVNNNKSAKGELQVAAYTAGKAIAITRTTGPHALSYYLTSNHGVPHGHAVALLLPLFFLYNEPGKELCELLGVENAKAAFDYIHEIMKQAGLEISLAELNIDKKKIIDDLLNEVNEERFANNPVAFDKDKLKRLILEYL
ncbi:MAG TPA: phosphonoacetaldehyde reductase [Chitinophagaceae bacterium]|jgi:alcohol dehydrogenase class IV|nr:phosphonoacetaldehyde reductase [Chitinophagaceae bacterium]